MGVGSSRLGLAARRYRRLEEAGNSNTVAGADMLLLERGAGNSKSVAEADRSLLGAVADSRLRVVVVWHMVLERSKWPL